MLSANSKFKIWELQERQWQCEWLMCTETEWTKATVEYKVSRGVAPSELKSCVTASSILSHKEPLALGSKQAWTFGFQPHSRHYLVWSDRKATRRQRRQHRSKAGGSHSGHEGGAGSEVAALIPEVAAASGSAIETPPRFNCGFYRIRMKMGNLALGIYCSPLWIITEWRFQSSTSRHK